MIRAALLTLTLMGGALAAQTPPMGDAHHPDRHRPGPDRIFKALSLSPGQEQAVHSAMDKHRAMAMVRFRALAAQEEALHAALEEPSTPEAQLQDLIRADREARRQVEADHRSLAVELNALLTPEQQAKARRIRASQRQEREAHRAMLEELGEAG